MIDSGGSRSLARVCPEEGLGFRFLLDVAFDGIDELIDARHREAEAPRFIIASDSK